MKFETINKNNKKYIIVGIILFCILGSVMVLKTTRAKYRTTQSINIVDGTVNYSASDLNLVAMYQENASGGWDSVATAPTSGYVLNTTESACKVNDVKDISITISYSRGKVAISNLIKKGAKCYLYFDKITNQTSSTIISSLNVKETIPDYTQAATTDEGVYKIADGMYGGDSYVFRGAVKNNWVKFAGYYWRIIRINGDGTMRLIYTGDASLTNVTVDANGITATGEGTQIGTSGYNSRWIGGEYVGYTYTPGSQRTKEGTPSTIKEVVDNWYNNNLVSYESKIADGKFCNDRNAIGSWSSEPSSTFYYAAYGRLTSAITPTLLCTNSVDIYILKAGLITADEVSMAGGLSGTTNHKYYLCTNQGFLTMTPYYNREGYPRVFLVGQSGSIYSTGYLSTSSGVRPVINLKADTKFQAGGTGTSSNPYVVL